jgi:hypothetical protein
MRFRTTLILLAIGAALAAYLLLVELERPASPAARGTPVPTPLPALLSFDTAAARAVRLASPATNQRTEMRLGEDGLWRIAVPQQAEADQGAVTRLVEDLATLRPQRAVEASGQALGDYDLDPPVLTAEVELADKTVLTLHLGATTASASATYAQVPGDARIYLIATYVSSDMEQYVAQPPVQPTPAAATGNLGPPVPGVSTPSSGR